MSFLHDFLPVLKRTQIEFVDKQHEVGDIYSFFFTPPANATWKAGQHGIISVPKRIGGRAWRAFSLASRPGEGRIRIATRIPTQPSPYKQALMQLTKGEPVFMRGPFGPFYFDGTGRPAVFIAGGIGITPFRALVQEALHNKKLAPKSIRLLYADNREQYCFQGEFAKAAAENPWLQAKYLNSSSLMIELARQTKELGNDASYFVSGSVQMVRGITKTLREQGIKSPNIHHDMFFGL